MGQIYCLPGSGGRIREGLGEELLRRGYDLVGRETVGNFKRLPFSAQMSFVAEDLESDHWHEESMVIANSFGAYLFLHAQTLLPPYIGRVLLLSPIVGGFTDPEQTFFYDPPQTGAIQTLAAEDRFPVPKSCEMHVGSLDWQSRPEAVLSLGNSLGIPVHVVPGSGHMLAKSYVKAVLDRWLR